MSSCDNIPSLLDIPESDSVVQVSIINTTTHIAKIPATAFFQPHINGFDFISCPAFSFLIDHPLRGKYVFDLGVRKDWENLAAPLVNRLKERG